MCGIVGCWIFTLGMGDRIHENIERALNSIKHRGPDDQGIWLNRDKGIIFGHNRLAIIDLSPTGHQPMVSLSGKSCVVFNGEIYNYKELKEKYLNGIHLRGTSDTEVMLELYEKFGIDFLQFLRGMFAFAIWNEDENCLFLARDRIGKKPLYYTKYNGNFFFASEIKGLRAFLPRTALTINQSALDAYLTLGFIPGDNTIYNEIKELLPGHFTIINHDAQIVTNSYWKLTMNQERRLLFREVVNEVDRILSDAVMIRLRADVPLGIFLSGGVDSGLLTAIASRFLPEGRLITISVGFKEKLFDERPQARLISNLYKTVHHEIEIESNFFSRLPEII